MLFHLGSGGCYSSQRIHHSWNHLSISIRPKDPLIGNGLRKRAYWAIGFLHLQHREPGEDEVIYRVSNLTLAYHQPADQNREEHVRHQLCNHQRYCHYRDTWPIIFNLFVEEWRVDRLWNCWADLYSFLLLLQRNQGGVPSARTEYHPVIEGYQNQSYFLHSLLGQSNLPKMQHPQ